jgi:murein DD-endopeptidase MepM/ murein hydrolase activator NlpD
MPVHAAVDGQVVRAGPVNGYGNAVAIRHATGGKSTFYAHLNSINVRLGESVAGGKVIGTVGRTTAGPDGVTPTWGRNMGPHLHMEVHPRPEPVLGSAIRRDDPVAWLRSQRIALVGMNR